MAKTAAELIREYRADPDNERLFRESRARRHISEKMTELRKLAHLTQGQLGARVGRSQPFIAKLEAGGYDKCGVSLLQTFAQAIGFVIDFDSMFVKSEAFFTGKSSCDEVEAWLPEDLRDLTEVITHQFVLHAGHPSRLKPEKMRDASRLDAIPIQENLVAA